MTVCCSSWLSLEIWTQSHSSEHNPPKASFSGSMWSGLQLNPDITKSFITSSGRSQCPRPQRGPYFYCDSSSILAAKKQRYFEMSVSAGVSFRLAITGAVRRRVVSAVRREPINQSRQPLIRQRSPHHCVTERERLYYCSRSTKNFGQDFEAVNTISCVV